MSSQSRFRVYIDGTLIYEPDTSVNEPEGILETELKIVRDEKLKGIFLEFVTDLTFWSAAYTYLKTVAINNDDCVSPDVRIEYQCGNDSGYETLFEGKIPLGSEDVEWDDFLCNVKTKVENADFSNFLQTYGDFKVKINNTTTIDGSTPLTPINSNDTELFNGFLGGLTGTGIRTYDFIPALQQVLSYLSNNEIVLSADPLYSTLFRPQIIEATMTAGVGDLEIEWVNYFGQTMRTVLTTGFEAVPATLHLNQSSGAAFEDRSNDFAKASNATIVGNVATITNYLPWQSWTFTYGPGVSVVETQAFVYGLKNLAFTNTTTIQEQYNDIYVSLNDLLIHAAQFSNMGYQLVKSGTNYNFNLRKIEDLFDDTGTAIQLSNISNIKHKSSGQYNLVNLTTPSGKADEVFQEQTYNTGNCFGDSLKVAGKNYSSQEFFDTIVNTQTQDDELMFLFLKEGDVTLAEMFPFRQQILALGRPNFSDEYYHYNAPYFQALIAARYNINNGLKTYNTEITLPASDGFAECDTCPVAFITNNEVLDLRRLYTFECPLSYAQIKSIRDNSLQLITFSDNLGVTKHGFLKEVTIPFKDFIAKFEVYSDK